MDALPDFETLADADLDALIVSLEGREDAISQRRRLLHGRIDLLRAERVSRWSARVAAEDDVDLPPPTSLDRPLFQGSGDVPAVGDEADLEVMPELASLADEELRALVLGLEQEEDDISLERRFLQGRIDILRAERSRRRHGSHLDTAGLADVLSRGARPS